MPTAMIGLVINYRERRRQASCTWGTGREDESKIGGIGMDQQYRQGDVLLIRVESVPGKLQRVPRDAEGRVVLAEGEATGHAHAIADKGAELLERADLQDRFLRVLAEGGVSLVHNEHEAITLPPGSYQVMRQREFRAGATGTVCE